MRHDFFHLFTVGTNGIGSFGDLGYSVARCVSVVVELFFRIRPLSTPRKRLVETDAFLADAKRPAAAIGGEMSGDA